MSLSGSSGCTHPRRLTGDSLQSKSAHSAGAKGHPAPLRRRHASTSLIAEQRAEQTSAVATPKRVSLRSSAPSSRGSNPSPRRSEFHCGAAHPAAAEGGMPLEAPIRQS